MSNQRNCLSLNSNMPNQVALSSDTCQRHHRYSRILFSWSYHRLFIRRRKYPCFSSKRTSQRIVLQSLHIFLSVPCGAGWHEIYQCQDGDRSGQVEDSYYRLQERDISEDYKKPIPSLTICDKRETIQAQLYQELHDLRTQIEQYVLESMTVRVVVRLYLCSYAKFC